MSSCIDASEIVGTVKGNGGGYPARGGRLIHRLIFEECFGPIPAGCVIMHTCDNRRCVNPEHLKCGTQAENNADMKAKSRAHKPTGETNPRARLTAEQVAEIRSGARFRGYVSQTAKKFQVASSTISMILTNRNWR